MPELYKKIFIANRGEIACRAIRTCQELNIQTVAAYSDCDRLSLHVRMADEAVCLGASPGNQSYLNIPKVIAAAKSKGCDAVYPGYGFLAENASFARACEEAGLDFIGPSAEVIEKMGDKEETRRTLKEYGIPIVPGIEDIEDIKEVIAFGNEVGWPILIKAAAGGGGKGMKLVYRPEEATEAFRGAQSIAKKSFGDGRVYVEKFIANGRHIEYQFVADGFGNVVHLGERECSIQRSHQKLVEEAPSSLLTQEKRDEVGQRVVNAIKKIGYITAGTMEFLFDQEGNYYALEVNTRIQVEHTVTELITGYDLIKTMITTRAGFPLNFTQEDVVFNGHAIQCRINAEDPKKNFTPSAGPILYLKNPEGHFIRMDSGIYQGWTIPVYYDSMLCKLCAYGKDRTTAITRIKRALEELKINGVQTTQHMHIKIMDNEAFVSGNYDTTFIPTYIEELTDYDESEVEILKIARLLAESTALGKNQHCF
ncbi:MAG TPA: acetyl-CoA carboxylase biotin carboxylase subunit [Myxococcales bacterium]|nr:acetyl-CoA carboxylase biotin carboxylase subunit [Myxococcales bacterium]|tara:strand:- start:1351 stop:2793 length:1443 start_codon:yes stop_codon:yes gene_type:complete